ncbi:hypothetical protein UFOVP116_67 [uncultured Caudovirales phage]|uniref:Uncharacterized protein n=1 Tax=uncultured Caudovirales phage TaxID=2100421 RepID=A0A6J5L8I8_9CAUD|nr:hypothetical protein UFOVP116_67 [uncultured Caudovirales phage]
MSCCIVVTFRYLFICIVDENYKNLSQSYPFISYVGYGEFEYIGVIQNSDDSITTIYDYGAIKDPALRKKFLMLADQWWWESNRKIPINLFLKKEWAEFKVYLKTLNSKTVEVKFGPMPNLNDLNAKKSKRKSVTSIKRPK